jgi:preprotein translocase subunit SecD
VAPPSGNASRPGRALATLVAIIVVLLLAVLGSNIANPGNWSKSFKVNLGLDLTSGTTVSLKAVPEQGHPLTQSAMAQAKQIMFNRVNGAGFTEAQVVQQGPDIINVSVPGQKSNQVVNLVSTTAQLYFRQVLLVASNSAPATPAQPTPTPSGSPSPSAKASKSPKAKASPSASTKAAGLPGSSGTRVREMSSSARGIGAAAAAQAKASPSPKASASAKASATPTPTPTASPAGSASPAPTPSPVPTLANHTTPWQEAQGDANLVSSHVKALFNKLDCANKNWQEQIGYGPAQFDRANQQIVACGRLGGVPVKYALDKSTVTGAMIKPGSVSAQPQQTSTTWQVNLNFNGEGTKAWGNLTTHLFSTYGVNSPLDQVAVVLDGVVKSAATVQGAITAGNTQITGNFDQTEATNLANVLAYGSLPLTFQQQSVETVTPQLGHAQLIAGLLAGVLGLLLVVVYLLIYYRGLAIIAASSLVIAAVLAYLSVIVLGKYQGLALSLSGIAGLIVAIGITADSFVVYFERLRDEVRDGGRSLRTAVEHGWTRARRTILVSDTVSFLAAALLYYFAIGDVRGFAFTLGLTTVIDIVVVFTFTKPMMTLLARTKFFGGGHPMSGLDPSRLGARAPWRGTPRPVRRPASARATSRPSQTKEA